MSLTYTDETNTIRSEEQYTPVYARRGARKQKKFKTWMILAPIGAVVLAGSAAMMLMGGQPETAALGESAPMEAAAPLAPVSAMAPVAATPLDSQTAIVPPAEVAASPAPVAAAPVVSARRAEPAAAPVQRRAAPVAAPIVEEAPAEPTGPVAYSASPSSETNTLNTAAPETTLPNPAPRAPAISVQPLN